MNNYYNNLNFINNLNIVHIIKNYVKLKKCGKNYKGFSPFKKENNPSFIVSPDKNIWKDFSSGKGGTLIKFIIFFFNYNYKQAINYLINKYKYNKYKKSYTYINTERKEPYKLVEKKSFYFINKILLFINKFYKKIIFKNKNILKYLFKRGINKKTLKYFEIGYSPNISLLYYLDKEKIYYNDFILKNTGLFIPIKKSFFYLFKSRIMFPVKNIHGNIIGFGGRTLIEHDKNKYINSPNNLLFNKKKILYGLYENNLEISRLKCCFLVEGYMDLLSLYNNNIKNVVATLGTNISQYQINLLLKFTNNIILLFDGDKSGINGAIKNINIFLANNINIKIFIFPKYQDPNNFILKNKYNDKINLHFKNKSLTFFDLKLKLYKNLFTDPFKKYTLFKDILNNIKFIKNKIIKDFYIKKLLKIFKINNKYLFKKKYNYNKELKPNNISINLKKNYKTKKKQYKTNINKFINKFKKKIYFILKKYYKLINFNLYYIDIYGSKQILNTYKILRKILILLKKHKIIFYKKKNNLLIKKIKKIITIKNKKKKENKKRINKNYSTIIRCIKEVIFKYKYFLFKKKINIYLKNIKNKNKNKRYYLSKVYFLIKKKKYILNLLYKL